MSMSAANSNQRRLSRPQHPRSSPPSVRPVRKTPIVYPALLSRVAEAFRDRISLSDKVKDGLTYKDAFDGREAVDKIAYIIKTTDRNLALLLGRALDAQKFFHDVTYDHRLRDSAAELYHFRTKLPSPFVSGDLPNVTVDFANLPLQAGTESSAEVSLLFFPISFSLTPLRKKLMPRPLSQIDLERALSVQTTFLSHLAFSPCSQTVILQPVHAISCVTVSLVHDASNNSPDST